MCVCVCVCVYIKLQLTYKFMGKDLEPGDPVKGVHRLELQAQAEVPHLNAAVLAARYGYLLQSKGMPNKYGL